MVLQIFGDYLSQPTRALLIFARANSIAHEVKVVKFGSPEIKQPEYLAVNPMGLVPAIKDDGFTLFESHAILKYLAATRSVPDHWYPADLKKRATLDCILDWHHVNLRDGTKTIIFQKVFGKKMGTGMDEKVIEQSGKILNASLKFIENNWLTDEGPFLAGASQPSIADLSLVCEIKQLKLLDRSDQESFLRSREKIRKWVQATEDSLAPHFGQGHSLLTMVSEKSQAKRDGGLRQSASL